MKKAPSSEARAQPKEKSSGDSALSEIYGTVRCAMIHRARGSLLTMMAVKATMKPIKSFILYVLVSLMVCCRCNTLVPIDFGIKLT